MWFLNGAQALISTFKYSADAESGMATALKEALSGSAYAKLVT